MYMLGFFRPSPDKLLITSVASRSGNSRYILTLTPFNCHFPELQDILMGKSFQQFDLSNRCDGELNNNRLVLGSNSQAISTYAFFLMVH